MLYAYFIFADNSMRMRLSRSWRYCKNRSPSVRLSSVPLVPRISQHAETISSHYTSRHGLRTLDLIHVAAASLLTATDFATYDERQRAVAEHIGLAVAP